MFPIFLFSSKNCFIYIYILLFNGTLVTQCAQLHIGVVDSETFFKRGEWESDGVF